MSQREPRQWSVDAPSIGGAGQVWAYGHYGRPVLAFPSQQGEVWDFGNNGMVDEIGWLIDEGRVKLYCVESFDGASWFDESIPFEERARRHNAYMGWIYDQVAPAIASDAGGRQDIVATGCSFGAYHAVNATLQRPDYFPIGLGMSGVYDIRQIGGWGDHGEAVYFANPADYVSNLHGDHLDWLRGNANPVLVVGQGQWEDTTGALESTKSFGQTCRDKGLNVEVDLWGHDVPHDWPSWRSMLAHHLQRFC